MSARKIYAANVRNRATNNAQVLLQRHIARPLKQKSRKAGPAAGGGRRHMDLVTIAVVGIIVVSYIVGSLTSSVETEQKLPHRF
jgi:hypothetical protein